MPTFNLLREDTEGEKENIIISLLIPNVKEIKVVQVDNTACAILPSSQ